MKNEQLTQINEKENKQIYPEGLKSKKLHLGCGTDYKQGWVNLDISNKCSPDVVHNLENPLPFPDNCFEEVYAKHVVEHIDNFVQLMNEIHRVSKNRGIVEILVPHFRCRGAYTDPTHSNYFTKDSFQYFESGSSSENSHYGDARFRVLESKRLQPGFRRFIPRRLAGLLSRFVNNMFGDIRFRLEVVK